MRKAKQGWEITLDRLELFIGSCLKERPSKGKAARCASHGGVANYLSSIMFMLKIVAPKTDPWIIGILRATRDAEKERHGESKMMEIVHPSELARIGLELMNRAQKSGISSRSAIEYRDGLLLWFGTIIPARSINLGSMQLDRDLFLGENPRIVWQAVDIKGRVAQTYDLPEDVADRLRVMRDKYRPMLMGAASDDEKWFWGPRRGGSGKNHGLTTSRINDIIANRSEEMLGKRVTGHSRRHSVATMITEEAPESIGHVTPLLQQGSSRSKSFYNRRAKKALASRASADVLSEIRQSFKKSA